MEKKILLVMGMRGTGKSTLVRSMLRARERVLVYDTLGEYSSADGIICLDLTELTQVWQHLYKGKFRIIYQPIDPVADFPAVCYLVYACGNLSFCVEEIDSFLSMNTAGIDFNFKNIVQRGRHQNIELIGVTQRPYTMPALLRSQCKELYTFRQFEQRDIDYLRAILGEHAEEVRDLKDYHFIALVNGKIERGHTNGASRIDKGNVVQIPEALPIMQQAQHGEMVQERD